MFNIMIYNITKIRIRLSICTSSEVVLSSICSLIFYYFAGYGHNLIVDVLRGTTEHREAMSKLMRSQPKTPEPLAAAMKDVDRDAARAV